MRLPDARSGLTWAPLRRSCLPALALLTAAIVAITGCGGTTKSSSVTTEPTTSSGTSPPNAATALLHRMFVADRSLRSGKMVMMVSAEVPSGASVKAGTYSYTVSGRFDSRAAGSLPQHAFDYVYQGPSGTQKASATSNAADVFVAAGNGISYALPDTIVDAARENPKSSAVLGLFAVDPARWVARPGIRGPGPADDAGADTTEVSGKVDVAALIDAVDVGASAEQRREHGPNPDRDLVTAAQKGALTEMLRDPSVQLTVGDRDGIMRHMILTSDVTPQASGLPAVRSFRIEFWVSQVNQPQTITIPANHMGIGAVLDGPFRVAKIMRVEDVCGGPGNPCVMDEQVVDTGGGPMISWPRVVESVDHSGSDAGGGGGGGSSSSAGGHHSGGGQSTAEQQEAQRLARERRQRRQSLIHARDTINQVAGAFRLAMFGTAASFAGAGILVAATGPGAVPVFAVALGIATGGQVVDWGAGAIAWVFDQAAGPDPSTADPQH